MINIELIRKKPKIVKKSLKDRGVTDIDLDKVIQLDKEYRSILSEIESLRAKQNKANDKISKAKNSNKTALNHN